MPQFPVAIITAVLAIVLFLHVAARTAVRAGSLTEVIPAVRRSDHVESPEGRSTKADMLIVFTTAWCGPCKEYKKVLSRSGLIVKEWSGEKGGSQVWIVDAEKYRDMANSYGVSGVPASFAIKGGKVVDSSRSWTEQELKGFFE